MTSGRRPKLDEENPGVLRQAASESSRKAVRQVREHRLPLTVAVQGRVVTTHPDGRTAVKSPVEAPRMKLVKGTVLVFE
jgi:hypothetical protein